MRKTGVLLGEEIKAANIIADGAVERCFKSASYDLRVGDQYIDPAENIDSETGEVKASAVSLMGKPIVVPAYSSIVVSTHEILRMPGDVIGKFNLRIKWALRGLFVQMGTQVEPHYYGRLFAVLHNITSKDISIKRTKGDDGHEDRDRLFTIEFYRIGTAAPGKSAVRPMDAMPDFVKDISFARSSINVMFEKSQTFEHDLRQLKSSVEQTIGELKVGLVQDAKRVLDSAQSQVDAAKSMSEHVERFGNDSVARLDQKFDEKILKIEAVEDKIGKEIEGLKRSKRELWLSVSVGAVIVLLASALIPFFISFAVSKTVPSFDTMLSPVRSDISTLQQKMDSITGKIDEDAKITSFEATIVSQQRQIEALVKRLDALQTQPTNNQAIDGSHTNPGRAQ